MSDETKKPKPGDVAPGAKFKPLNGADDMMVYEASDDQASPFCGIDVVIERWNGTAVTNLMLRSGETSEIRDSLTKVKGHDHSKRVELANFLFRFFHTSLDENPHRHAGDIKRVHAFGSAWNVSVIQLVGKKKNIEARIVKGLSAWHALDQYRKEKHAKIREEENARTLSSFAEGPVAKVITFPGAREIYNPDGSVKS